MIIDWIVSLFSRRSKEQPPVDVAYVENEEDRARRRRDNAALYRAQEFARVSLRRGDKMGAFLDFNRKLEEYGYDRPPWFVDMALDALQGSLKDVEEFIEGFAVDVEGARKMLGEEVGGEEVE